MRSVHADALVGDPGQAGARQVQGRRLASLPEGQRLESLVPRDERVRVASGDVDDGVAGPDRPRAPTLPEGRGAAQHMEDLLLGSVAVRRRAQLPRLEQQAPSTDTDTAGGLADELPPP